MTKVQRIQNALNRVKVHSSFPYPTEFVAHEVGGGIQIEARPTMISVETGKPQKGIFPDYCSVVVSGKASERAVHRAAHQALTKFMAHEASEALTVNGKHIVDPHPELA